MTIAIPTYGRDTVLIETLEHVLALIPAAGEVLVLDQTPRHEPAVEQKLRAWDAAGAIVWARLPRPSIPHAMNEALLRARNPIVLFLDDDLIPAPSLVAQHRNALAHHGADAVVGQILQPGETVVRKERGGGLMEDLDFAFNSDAACEVTNVMAGNLAVRRERAIAVGGFDTNFVTTAYRFETDFAWRLIAGGGRIWFEPSARINHLKAGQGGLRSWGSHLTSGSPAHSTGDYYFALMNIALRDRITYMLRRMRRTILSRFDLSHPWWIPIKLIRELRALLEALRLARRGRRLLSVP